MKLSLHCLLGITKIFPWIRGKSQSGTWCWTGINTGEVPKERTQDSGWTVNYDIEGYDCMYLDQDAMEYISFNCAHPENFICEKVSLACTACLG